MTWFGAIADGLTVAVLAGIFYRLGSLGRAIGDLADRIQALESWRSGFFKTLAT